MSDCGSPANVGSMEARSGERRHTRTMNRIHDWSFESGRDLFRVVVSPKIFNVGDPACHFQ